MTEKIFTDPVSGETMCFVKTGADLLELEAAYRPGSPKPPMHFHPAQQEHFKILAGSMTVEMDEQQRVYQPGEAFDVPAGMPHAMWNAGGETTRLNWQIRPALKSEAFFETLWGLRQAGKTSRSGVPSLLQTALLMQAYQAEFRPVSPPGWLQPMLFGVLAWIAKRRVSGTL